MVVHLGSRGGCEDYRIYIMIISGQRVKKKDGVDKNISENYNVSLPEVAVMLAECCYRCLGLNIIIMT